jgi:hypothetical protein
MTTMRALSDQLQLEAVQTRIYGLVVTKNTGGNTLDISAGACYDPSSGRIIVYAGATAVNAGTLGASQWNQVYLYDSSGTATVEVVNNAAPPSTTYAGTARKGGTNSNRRWIGSFLTTSGSNITPFDARELVYGHIEIIWLIAAGGVTRVLSAGSSTTFATVSLLGCVPRYVCPEVISVVTGTLITTAVDDVLVYVSVDGTIAFPVLRAYGYSTTAGLPNVAVRFPIDSATPQTWYKVAVGSSGVGPRAYLDIYGFLMAR